MNHILAKGTKQTRTDHIIKKEPSELLYCQRNQVNQSIIKGTKRTLILATNYILAKEPTNKSEMNPIYIDYVDHPM